MRRVNKITGVLVRQKFYVKETRKAKWKKLSQDIRETKEWIEQNNVSSFRFYPSANLGLAIDNNLKLWLTIPSFVDFSDSTGKVKIFQS